MRQVKARAGVRIDAEGFKRLFQVQNAFIVLDLKIAEAFDLYFEMKAQKHQIPECLIMRYIFPLTRLAIILLPDRSQHQPDDRPRGIDAVHLPARRCKRILIFIER